MGSLCTSDQFLCKPKTARKNKFYKEKRNSIMNVVVSSSKDAPFEYPHLER